MSTGRGWPPSLPPSACHFRPRCGIILCTMRGSRRGPRAIFLVPVSGPGGRPGPVSPTEARMIESMTNNKQQGDAVYLTAEGRRRLEEELVQLTTVERASIAARLHSAIKDGDLSENAAYTHAKEDQGHLEGRIAQIQASLRRAVLIDETGASDTVGLG